MTAAAAGTTPEGRIAFVPPRYGDRVVGGAEAVIREVAHGFAGRGWTVEVLTTCARDHFTWSNEFAAGVTRDGLLTVRRFPTIVDTDRSERRRLDAAVLAGQQLTVAEQERWLNDDLRVPELFHYLLDSAEDYQALIFAPYMFWTTVACSQVAPERSVLMPCLHDEPWARLEIFRPMVSGCAGIWFQTEPEHRLGHRLFYLPQQHEVVGSGMRIPEHYDPDAFRRRFGIDGRFILFAGRREGAKGWEQMLDAFATAVATHDLPFSLVTMGTGDVHPPASIRDRVVDIGFVDDTDRDNAFAAADAYLQPSAYEAFSRTIMEAWLAGTIVVANGASDVVRWHCERSGAGLTYDDRFEFAECLAFVAESPRAARRLAARGRGYVMKHYAPETVLNAQEATLRRWFGLSKPEDDTADDGSSDASQAIA